MSRYSNLGKRVCNLFVRTVVYRIETVKAHNVLVYRIESQAHNYRRLRIAATATVQI